MNFFACFVSIFNQTSTTRECLLKIEGSKKEEKANTLHTSLVCLD